MIETLKADGWPEPIGPFSLGKKAGDFLFLSGQCGTDKSGKLVPGGVAAEAEQTMKNLEELLKSAGLTFENAVDVLCLLTDIGDFQAFNAVYAKYFGSKPARTCFAVKDLPGGASCEVRVTAYLK